MLQFLLHTERRRNMQCVIQLKGNFHAGYEDPLHAANYNQYNTFIIEIFFEAARSWSCMLIILLLLQESYEYFVHLHLLKQK